MKKKKIIERRCRRCHRKYYLQRRKHIPLDSIKFCPACLFEQMYNRIFFSDISPEEIEIPVEDFRKEIERARKARNAHRRLRRYIRKAKLSDRQREAIYDQLKTGIKSYNYWHALHKLRKYVVRK